MVDYSKWNNIASSSEDEEESDSRPFGDAGRCVRATHDAQVLPFRADSRGRDVKACAKDIAKAETLIREEDWKGLHDSYCLDGDSEPEVLRLIMCCGENLQKLAHCISDPQNAKHGYALGIVRACACWSEEMSAALSKSDVIIAALSESLSHIEGLDANFGAPGWERWFVVLRLCRHCKPSAFEPLVARFGLPSVISNALQHIAKESAQLIQACAARCRLGTWHLPMCIWAVFVKDGPSFSPGFVSEHFLSRPIGTAVASILKELDKKGYAEVIGGSCGINIDLVNIVGAVGALIKAHALQNSTLESLRLNNLVGAYARGNFRRQIQFQPLTKNVDIVEHDPYSDDQRRPLIELASGCVLSFSDPRTPCVPEKQAQASSSEVCANCGSMPSKAGQKYQLCSSCKVVKYCSRSCQKDHWRLHKRQCKTPMTSAKIGDVDSAVAASTCSDEHRSRLSVGCTVKVQGLTKDASLNGAHAVVAALRIDGSEKCHAIIKKSGESISISPGHLQFISNDQSNEEITSTLLETDTWDELRDAFAWADRGGKSAHRTREKEVLLVSQSLDPTRLDTIARIQFMRKCIAQASMPRPKCADLMAPRSSWEGQTSESAMQMQMMARMLDQGMQCKGTGYVDFALFDSGLDKYSGNKRRQRRAARFREWYLSGFCVVCQQKMIESAANYVFDKGQWQPCRAPRSVA